MLFPKPIGWLALAGVLLAGCQPDHPTGLPASSSLAALHGTWLLVPESSHADTLVYRRNTYRFKYRRGGRPGFQLGPAGRFVRYDVVPDGGLLAQEGSWVETSTSRLLVHLPELAPAEPDYELELLDYQNGVLRLRRLARRPAVEVLRTP